MSDDQTVTLSRQEWQQLVAVLANATGYVVMNKMFAQLQQQTDQAISPNEVAARSMGQMPSGDGLDLDAPVAHRRVPRN